MTDKRIISIGSEKPKSLDGNIIYVTVTERGKDKLPDIDVISSDSFGYRNFALRTMPRMEVRHVGNQIGDINGYYRLPLETVLDALTEENKVDISHRD